jgi:hypothetical protein
MLRSKSLWAVAFILSSLAKGSRDIKIRERTYFLSAEFSPSLALASFAYHFRFVPEARSFDYRNPSRYSPSVL